MFPTFDSRPENHEIVHFLRNPLRLGRKDLGFLSFDSVLFPFERSKEMKLQVLVKASMRNYEKCPAVGSAQLNIS